MADTPRSGDIWVMGGTHYLLNNFRNESGRAMCSLHPADDPSDTISYRQDFPIDNITRAYEASVSNPWSLVKRAGPVEEYTVVDCSTGCGKFVIPPGNEWTDKCENCR